MILAGEIGATRTRLAAFETEGNRLSCVVEKDYVSHDYPGLAEILPQFIRTEGIGVHSACFGVAGPVRSGRSKISNLPWTIDSGELAKQLKLPSRRSAQRSGSLRLRHRRTRIQGLHHAQRRLRRCRRQPSGHLGENRTRRRRPVLGRIPPSSLPLRRRPRRLRSAQRTADGVARLSLEEAWTRQRRTHSLRPGHQEYLRFSARHTQSRGTRLATRPDRRGPRRSGPDLATGPRRQGRRSASRPCRSSSASSAPRPGTAPCTT